MEYTQNNPLPIPAWGETHAVESTIKTVFDWKYALQRHDLLGDNLRETFFTAEPVPNHADFEGIDGLGELLDHRDACLAKPSLQGFMCFLGTHQPQQPNACNGLALIHGRLGA